MRIIWFVLGVISLALGIIGIPLPGLPTVPLLLLAAFFFARSSERAHKWLINHPKLGPPIADWNENGAIRRPAKIMASICISASFLITLILGVPVKVIALQAITLTCVAIFIWTRPSS